MPEQVSPRPQPPPESADPHAAPEEVPGADPMQVLQTAPLAMIRVGTIRGRYLLANKAYVELVGRSLEELMTRDAYELWLEVTHPEDVEPERREIERVARGEIDEFTLEKRLIHKNGSARWVRAQLIAQRDPSGRLAAITVYFTDIHEQRLAAAARERLEAQLRQAQKLSALGKLAGGVAHDFNNRLLIIMGYAQMLQRDLPAGSPLLDNVEMVLGSSRRAAELTHQLLAYSRHQVLKPEVFDLGQALDGMRSMLSRLIGEDIQLVTVYGSRHPIHSDRGQLEQVLLNLVVNARDAMPKGGCLTLETRDSRLESGNDANLPAGDYVSLLVSDTGVGIEPQVLPHIFEPFFTTKEVGKGSGLGLSMVEGVVNQSGGGVIVESELGRGATFTVHLPRSREASVSVQRKPENSFARGVPFETVLICDDDDDVRKLLVDVLAFRGYQTLQATSGRHALGVAREHDGPIHLLVTDVIMPELGGLELAESLRQRYPDLKVLFVSGYTDNSAQFSGSLGPNTLFLPKPFLPGELTGCVCELLEAQGARSASG